MFHGNVAKWVAFQSRFFREMYTARRCDRHCRTKLRGEGTLIAVSEAVFGVKLSALN